MQSKLGLLLSMTRGRRHLYLLAFGSLLVGTLLLYGQPIVIGIAVDRVLGNSLEDESPVQRFVLGLLGGEGFLRANLWIAAIAAVVATSLGGLFTFGKMRLGAVAAESIIRSLRDRLYDHLQHLPCSYHDGAQTGDLVQRCSSDVDTVRLFYTDQLLEVGRASVLLLTALPLMVMLDPVLALVAVAVLPVITLFAVIFFRKVAGTFKAMDEAEGALTTTIQENLTGVRVVRAFARQQFELDKFARRNDDHRAKHWKLYKIMSIYWSSSDFLCFTQLVLVLIVGAVRVQGGAMTTGTLVSFLGFVAIYLWPVRQMGRIVTEMGKTTVAIGRIKEILDAPAERQTTSVQSQAPGASPMVSPDRAEITFDHVSFSHKGNRVLHEISFTIPAGTTLALLGPSGSGKTTIAQLLMRFYEPESGRILLSGVDIATLPLAQVRRQIGAVMQEPFLFSKTVRENLKLGRFDAGDVEMIEAAGTASIHPSIERFEKKYDTVVGERGVTLSGGQRQRVAIARALLKQAPVLILDDALSAVDTHTESMILGALRQKRGQTTLLIAHRLSTVMHAEQIVVLDHGRIVQRGTHAELVEVDGMYRRLWSIQSALEEDLSHEFLPLPAGEVPRSVGVLAGV